MTTSSLLLAGHAQTGEGADLASAEGKANSTVPSPEAPPVIYAGTTDETPTTEGSQDLEGESGQLPGDGRAKTAIPEPAEPLESAEGQQAEAPAADTAARNPHD